MLYWASVDPLWTGSARVSSSRNRTVQKLWQCPGLPLVYKCKYGAPCQELGSVLPRPWCVGVGVGTRRNSNMKEKGSARTQSLSRSQVIKYTTHHTSLVLGEAKQCCRVSVGFSWANHIYIYITEQEEARGHACIYTYIHMYMYIYTHTLTYTDMYMRKTLGQNLLIIKNVLVCHSSIECQIFFRQRSITIGLAYKGDVTLECIRVVYN